MIWSCILAGGKNVQTGSVAHPASYLAGPMFLSFFPTSSSSPPLSYSLFSFFLYLFKE
jgi:hypothetical protein